MRYDVASANGAGSHAGPQDHTNRVGSPKYPENKRIETDR
jgi:hypothetical protein